MEMGEWIDLDLMMVVVLVMLVWRQLLEDRYERWRDPNTLRRKLEREQANRGKQ